MDRIDNLKVHTFVILYRMSCSISIAHRLLCETLADLPNMLQSHATEHVQRFLQFMVTKKVSENVAFLHSLIQAREYGEVFEGSAATQDLLNDAPVTLRDLQRSAPAADSDEQDRAEQDQEEDGDNSDENESDAGDEEKGGANAAWDEYSALRRKIAHCRLYDYLLMLSRLPKPQVRLRHTRCDESR